MEDAENEDDAPAEEPTAGSPDRGDGARRGRVLAGGHQREAGHGSLLSVWRVEAGQIAAVGFDFTNNGGDEVVVLSAESVVPLDTARGREFKTGILGYVEPAKDVFRNQANPGVTQHGEVTFTGTAAECSRP